jgi:hypothetical protein
MLVNVLDLLRPLQTAEQAKSDEALSDLAARIACGDSLSSQEILAALDRINATPEELQAETARHGRLRELTETIRTGKGARRRLMAINAELKKAQDEAGAAQAKSDAVAARLDGEWRMMTDAVRAADDAVTSLTKNENLSAAHRASLAALDAKMQKATDDLAATRSLIPRLRELIKAAEQALEAAGCAGRESRKIAQRTLDARRRRLKQAEDEVARLTMETTENVERREAIYAAIRRAAGA